MQETIQPYLQDRTDAKACLTSFILRIPYLLIIAVAGALIGSGLYLLIASLSWKTPAYYAETEYYIDFADGRLEAKDYYNDFTWNDVMATDPILGKAMEKLGDTYMREDIKEMITADILSDVRYLTITVEGTDAQLVDRVSKELKSSLVAFGADKEEFDSISQIEDNGVKQREKKYFTWRAAVLGTLVFAIGYILVFFVHFNSKEQFLTRTDVMQYLQVNALGMLMKAGSKKYAINNECMENIRYMKDKQEKKVVYLNLGKEDSLEQQLTEQDTTVFSVNSLNSECYETIRESSGVILCIPWGVSIKSKVTDVIHNLRVQDCHVIGAVLTEADSKWLSLYGLLK